MTGKNAPTKKSPHLPVMPEEIISALNVGAGMSFIDGTLGAGGHSEAILHKSAPDGTILAFDLDENAIHIAQRRLQPFADRITIIHDSYVAAEKYAQANSMDGFLLDLGVSSMQIDNSERGFSFLQDGPLDMRFSNSQHISAYEIVNESSEEYLSKILNEYGEERSHRKIAATICSQRHIKPICTTKELADLISTTVGVHEKIHPATRSFQAIRIAVNDELQQIATVLPASIRLLKPGGRLAVISFHSLEDRIVKQFMRNESRNCICPPQQPVCTCGHYASIREINHRPLTADDSEIQGNIRARSAKLRIAEKLVTI